MARPSTSIRARRLNESQGDPDEAANPRRLRLFLARVSRRSISAPSFPMSTTNMIWCRRPIRTWCSIPYSRRNSGPMPIRAQVPQTRIAPGQLCARLYHRREFRADMDDCEFAITFLRSLRRSPNICVCRSGSMRIAAGAIGPERLVKRADTDWEKSAAEKTAFCNFVYLHDVPYRDAVFPDAECVISVSMRRAAAATI